MAEYPLKTYIGTKKQLDAVQSAPGNFKVNSDTGAARFETDTQGGGVDIAGGGTGYDGWTPVLAVASDGERQVQRVTDWTGGTGEKPATGVYVGETGFVSDIGLASDIRGEKGMQGPTLGVGSVVTEATEADEAEVLITQVGVNLNFLFRIPSAGSGVTPVAAPEYLQAAIPPFLSAIEAQRTPASTLFIVMADPHVNPDSANYTADGVAAYMNVISRIRPDFGVMTGDFAADASTASGGAPPYSDNRRYLGWIKDQVDNYYAKSTMPFFICRGNHDLGLGDGNTSERFISRQEFYTATEMPFQARQTNVHDPANPVAPYYYYDLHNKKIRIICLDTSDIPGTTIVSGQNYGWRAQQLKWFGESALNLSAKENPAEWKVMIFQHVPPLTELNYKSSGGVENPVINDDVFLNIVNAFETGGSYSSGNITGSWGGASVSVNYAAQGAGDILFLMHGHNHADNSERPTMLPLVPVCVACDLMAIRDSATLPGGSVVPQPRATPGSSHTHVCFTAFLYRPDTGKLMAWRFGAPSSVFPNSYTGGVYTYPATTLDLAVTSHPTITGMTVSPSTFDSPGGTATVTITGQILNTAQSMAVTFNGAEIPVTNIGTTSATVTLTIPANAESDATVYPVGLKVNGAVQAQTAQVTVNPASEPIPVYALTLNGGYGNIPSSNGLSTAGIQSVKFGFRLTSVPSSARYFFHSSAGSNQRFYLGISAGKIIIGFGSVSSQIGNFTFSAGVDYEVELVIDQSGGRASVYINGDLDKQWTAAAFSTAAAITFGTNSGAAGSSYIQARMHYFTITNTGGSAWAKYDMQQASGSSVLDSSGNGRHITLTGDYEFVRVN